MEPQATQPLSSSQAPASPQQPASPKTTPRAPRTAPPSFERCRARTRQSARCRLHADPATGLCPRHQHLSADPPEDCDVLDHFQGRFDDLTTALTINDFLRMVAYLLVQNKISNRRAAVLTTLCGHLLRTVPLIDKEMEELKSQPDSFSSHRDAPSNPAAPQANATPSWRLPLSPSTLGPARTARASATRFPRSSGSRPAPDSKSGLYAQACPLRLGLRRRCPAMPLLPLYHATSYKPRSRLR